MGAGATGGAGRSRDDPEVGIATAIRPATRADLPAIGRLGAHLIDTHRAFDARRFLASTPRTPQDYASYLGTQLDDPDVAVLVALDGDAVVGYAYCASEGHDWMALRGPAGVLHDIVVDPAARGQGVGRALLDAALAFLRSRGAPRVVLMTAHLNDAAQRLFARAAFRPTMVEMTRELDDA